MCIFMCFLHFKLRTHVHQMFAVLGSPENFKLHSREAQAEDGPSESYGNMFGP